MSTQDKRHKRPERKQTDESLAGERAKTDHALREKNAALEHRADVVIERAREDADEVLNTARAKADEKLRRPVSVEDTQAAVAEARVREDRALERERADADDALRDERRASARVLARLLPLEREKTDQYLLTERARSDDSLANRDDFLGMVSHDLRNLLHGIVMNASLIADHTSKDEQGKSSLVGAQRIQRAAARMGRLIGDLVDIASIEAGKLAIVPTVIDATGVVLDAVETWAPAAQAKGITLEAPANGAPPLLAKLDNERVLQILGNLIINSVKFTASGGKIEVAVERVGKDARFSVKDTGVGVPTEKLEAIFERFWQVGRNDSRGLGLGLYISRCLAHAHGGEIWAQSEIGVGSTFFFTVPCAD